MPPFLAPALEWLQNHLDIWVLIGLAGQSMFFMRFLYQWIASEKAKKSVVPEAFWYFSLAGGLIILAYALHKKDVVFIMGQLPGAFIYTRNIYLIRRHKQLTADTTQS